MEWWDVVVVMGVIGGAFGMAGGVFTLLRALPWGKDWNVGGYQ